MSDTNVKIMTEVADKPVLLSQPDMGSTTNLVEDITKQSFSGLVEAFPDAWAYLAGLFGGHTWVLFMGIIFLVTFTLDFIIRNIFKTLDKQFKKKGKDFLVTITKALIAPISFYIWLSGLVMGILLVFLFFPVFKEAMPYVNGFKSTLSVIAVAWFSIRWVQNIEFYFKSLGKESNWDPVTIEAMAKVFKLTVFIFTGLFVLSSLGVNLTGLIAFGGMGGVAVGFAAKDFVGNLIGGLMIYMDKPFKVGDWICSPDKSIEGTVESIGWRMTVIRTFDKRPLYVPNGTFSVISIENPSRMTNRRIKETIGVRYDDLDQVKSITEGIRKMLIAHDDIDNGQTMFVYLGAFGESTLDIDVYTFTKTTAWVPYRRIKQDVLLKIAGVISDHGAEIAFPTRTLYMAEAGNEQPMD